MSARRGYDGGVAALPLAAGATLLLADWLPVRFEYRENDLGIVGFVTQHRYPVQQETFWVLFAGGVAGLLAWVFARALRRTRLDAAAIAAVEILAAGALLATLWLPDGAALLGWVVLAAGAWALVLRLGGRSGDPPTLAPEARPARGSVAVALACGAVLVLGLLLAPGVWENLWSVAHGVADERGVANHFKFLAEKGQHLAWADALLRGGLQGRDFFCLYGPLYDLGIVGMWQLVGRSIAGFELYWSLTRVLGWLSLFGLGFALLRRPWLVLALPFLLPWVKLRVGLALFGLLFLLLWMRSGRSVWGVVAGAAGAVALLFSQEFGLGFLLVACLGLGVRRDGRGALLFGAGFAALVVPVLGYYAAQGALTAMLRDLVQYPAFMLAGYGKLPFPALVPSLPLDPLAPGERASLALRLGYAAPAVCVGAALLLLPLGAFDARRPRASLRAMRDALARDPERLALLLVALFGVIAFRSALGRSQLPRTLAVLPPVALLLVCGLDRALDLARSHRPLAAWRGLALLLLVVYAGFFETTWPPSLVGESLRNVAVLARTGHHPRGDARVMRVTRWIQLHTEPGEPVLFLPNDAAYYYLTERSSPTRFVLGHQMVTDAHRAEALAALRANPPRYVVWDHGALRVDDVPDEQVFGPGLLGWLRAHYEPEVRFDEVEILRWREAPE